MISLIRSGRPVVQKGFPSPPWFSWHLSLCLGLTDTDERIMTNTNFIAVLWLLAVAGALVLLIAPVAKTRLIAWLAAGLCILVILPWVGYPRSACPGTADTAQERPDPHEMLSDGKIQPRPLRSANKIRSSSQDRPIILLKRRCVRKADWFEGSVRSYSDFKLVSV